MEKRLYKINRGKMVDGVCGGIAEYFGMESLYTATENRRIRCEFFNGLTGETQAFDERFCATG